MSGIYAGGRSYNIVELRIKEPDGSQSAIRIEYKGKSIFHHTID